VASGHQAIVRIRYNQDSSGAWWLYYNNEAVGVFPRCHDADSSHPCSRPTASYLFASSGLRDFATRVEFYGEVGHNGLTTATSTDMGSSKKASAGFQQAAYARTMQVLQQNQNASVNANWQYLESAPGSDTSFQTDTACYSINVVFNTELGNNGFYYGGRGDEESGCN
jgi:hypothetical protein